MRENHKNHNKKVEFGKKINKSKKNWKKSEDFFSDGQFTGTSQFYKYYNLYLTDGAKYVADTFGAYWVFDMVVSYYNLYKGNDFLLVKVRVNQDTGEGLFTIEDGNEVELINQKIPYTDLKENLIFYLGVADGEYKQYIICLPSEN